MSDGLPKCSSIAKFMILQAPEKEKKPSFSKGKPPSQNSSPRKTSSKKANGIKEKATSSKEKGAKDLKISDIPMPTLTPKDSEETVATGSEGGAQEDHSGADTFKKAKDVPRKPRTAYMFFCNDKAQRGMTRQMWRHFVICGV